MVGAHPLRRRPGGDPFLVGKLADIVGLMTLVCGLAYVVMRTRRPIPPLKAEQGPDKRDVQRDLPPPPG